MCQKAFIKSILLVSLFLFVDLIGLPAAEVKTTPATKVSVKNDTVASHWMKLETRYTIIHYQSIQSLEQFHKSIHFGNGWWATSTSFEQLSNEENLKITRLKIDGIFQRVQEILDMKKKFPKVKIHLYPNKTLLENAYLEKFKKKSPYRAWYEFKTNTISLNVLDCHEGMVAHEIAHSIIDNYLEIRPPKNTAEILARYVDTHLK